MSNHSCDRGQKRKRSGAAGFTEPEVRRWPHPIDGITPAEIRPSVSECQTDALLYYIHGALSCQNQLLGEIKALLEQLVPVHSQNTEEK